MSHEKDTAETDSSFTVQRFEVPVDERGSPTEPPGSFLVEVELSVRGVSIVATRLSLSSTDGGPVGPDEWRVVKIGTAIRAARERLEGALDAGWYDEDPEARAWARLLRTAMRLDDDPNASLYVRVASVYTAAVRSGDSSPVQTVIRAMRSDYPRLKESTVKGWIRTARVRGYIATETRARPARGTTTSEETDQ